VFCFLVSLFYGGCGAPGGQAASAPAPAPAPAPAGERSRVREPAVAGLFYPRQRDELTRRLERLLAGASKVPLGKLRGLVCPHAGYEFSGPTAALAYKQVAGGEFDTVAVLAPSHYAHFRGAAIPDVDAFSTPLGEVRLSPRAAQLAKVPPFGDQLPADVERPRWWRDSSLEKPPDRETPHTWEHSLEVQLPFLQHVLPDFRLIPIVFGQAEAAVAARELAAVIDDKTLVIASSDLSHFYPSDVAEELDASCVRAICDLDTKWLADEDACGKLPVLILLHLARAKGWQAKLLEYRHSGDTGGDRTNVVGYAAIAFFEGAAPTAELPRQELTADERQFLLTLARRAITSAVQKKPAAPPPVADVPSRLQQRGACFVTLTKAGQLRGCIGHVFACQALHRDVATNAVRAALSDSRFPAVTARELPDIKIEISLLTQPRPLEAASPDELLQKLRPGVDGVMFSLRGKRATYLPQVWAQIPDKEEFLSSLAKKARTSPQAWKDPTAAWLTYQVVAFHETEK
jgi:AmmeMemoRadiSam system protein B/AmmeMemoRadiSam system protein A